jgi:hypothetical protein
MISIGGTLLAVGFLTFWLPIPVGLPLALIGILILTRYSMNVRQAIAGASRRFPRFRQWFKRLRQLRRRVGL